jgi:hypothetical protein
MSGLVSLLLQRMSFFQADGDPLQQHIRAPCLIDLLLVQ